MAYSIITTEAHVIRAMAACGGLYGLLDYRPGRANLKRIWRRCRCWGLGTGRLHWRLLGCIGSILLLLGRRSWLLLHRLLGWCRHWTRGRAGRVVGDLAPPGPSCARSARLVPADAAASPAA